MRLAFEDALRKAGVDVFLLESAAPEQIAATWVGPRDHA